MTLEQVFIEIGDREISKQIKLEDDSTIIEDVFLKEMPPQSNPRFCGKFKALLISNF